MNQPELRSISEVAEAFDMSVSALRYYDELGLVPPAQRRARVRFYDEEALRRLAFVRLWHDDGMMSLDDTALIMAGPTREQWRELVSQRLTDIAETAARLNDARRALEHLLQCPRDNPLECPVIGEQVQADVHRAFQ
ncbi:MerR family transcriptional regulator [Nonomuraea angiospora]|nr:MerR family transcriptional regulator [Nonomuraea angiospora]MDX3110025.1 MerR family DNA-binding transcriptional regulator [Nonomuraea angiospora]